MERKLQCCERLCSKWIVFTGVSPLTNRRKAGRNGLREINRVYAVSGGRV